MSLPPVTDMLPATPLGQLLVALVGLSASVLVGRFVLSIAWKLLIAATLMVGVIYTAGILI